MRLRQICLDTETTGLDPHRGHRIIEIGCVELIDRKLTQNHFHLYLNPDREIDEGAVKIHGITNTFLEDKPKFSEVFADFFEFVHGAQLIIHNAAFDTAFINHEFKRHDKSLKSIDNYCSILDTLLIARQMHPGQKNNLDALCKRYGIDNSHREFHGALKDAQILAQVYLSMTGGQTSLFAKEQNQNCSPYQPETNIQILPDLPVIPACAAEIQAHTAKITSIAQKNKGICLWELANETEKI